MRCQGLLYLDTRSINTCATSVPGDLQTHGAVLRLTGLLASSHCLNSDNHSLELSMSVWSHVP